MLEYFVIFGGGGIRGLSYCGACKALQERNIILTGCAGSSIGAVFASLYSVGYSFDEIYELIASTGFEMFIDVNLDIKKDIGFSKGNIFYKWIKEKIEQKFYGVGYKKGNNKSVCFADIKNKLVIFATDLTNLKYKEYSYLTTPDVEIAKAVRASVSMPGLFTPIEDDGCLITDGDLLKSAPLWRISNTIKNLNEKIIEFRLEDNETKNKINNSIEYINRVYNVICGFATDYIIDMYKEKDKFDYIKIDTPGISVVDFLIPKEKKKELFEIGYKTTIEYLDNFFKEKRRNLLIKYKKLLAIFIEFQKKYSKNNFIGAYFMLSECFMYICEEKKYLDTFIYNKILDFKNLFLDNYKQNSLLFVYKARMNNKQNIYEKLLELIKVISLKIEELD